VKKVFVKTYGCQMNEYDSSKMVDVLWASKGYTRTTNINEADLLLLNTCSIREKAQEKVFSELGRWRELKESNPNILIGVGGCVASQEGELLRQRAPFVDIVFGPQTLHRLPQLLDEVGQKHKAVVDIEFTAIEKFDNLPEPRADGPSAYVSIMEGCSKYCTFCVVPYTRGEEISRPLDDVIAEVVLLVAKGVREIILLGQNVNAYQGELFGGGDADLALLLNYVAAIDGVDRIRYTTSHPVEMTASLIQAHAEVDQLVEHLHLPVQSGSDRILSLMKRGHSVAEYVEKIKALKKVKPAISISSDFIVGYPGETEDDFNATMALIDEIGFDHSYSFVYSARPGTPAASAIDDVSMETKKQRLALLQKKISNLSAQISRRMVGTDQIILVSRVSTKQAEQMAGRTENNRVVNFTGDKNLIGQFVTVKITSALPNSLQGELVEQEQLENSSTG